MSTCNASQHETMWELLEIQQELRQVGKCIMKNDMQAGPKMVEGTVRTGKERESYLARQIAKDREIRTNLVKEGTKKEPAQLEEMTW